MRFFVFFYIKSIEYKYRMNKEETLKLFEKLGIKLGSVHIDTFYDKKKKLKKDQLTDVKVG